jgi:hypothetical protein
MKNDLSIVTPIEDLENELLNADKTDDLVDIIDLFNLNLQKKNIIRNKKLSDVQDKVVDRMLEKIQDEPWEFSNDDLIKFHKVIQDTLKSTDTLDKESIPTIQVNQQINVSAPEFNRESREKILSAVRDILKSNNEELEEVETVDDK